MIRRLSWFAFFLILAVSCLDEPDCFNLNNNFIGISFRRLSDLKQDSTILLWAQAETADSVFIDEPFPVYGAIKFPLNYLQDQTTFTFQRPGQNGTILTNTLVVGYKARAQFVSEECGERFVLSGLHVISSDFDSTRIVVTDPFKTVSSSSVNLIIYRCPITNYMKFSFRQLYTDTVKLGVPLPVTIDNLNAEYSGEIFYQDATANLFSVPVDPSSNTTQFNFSSSSGDSSIVVTYNKVQATAFDVCGPQDFYTDLAIQSSDFPITKLIYDSLQDPSVPNIAFLKCPTTNLVRMQFKSSTASNAANRSFLISKITDNYTSDIYYQDTTVNIITLPLNLNADQTTFTIEFNNSGTLQSKTLGLKYTRSAPYHEGCTDQLISSLEIITSGFTTTPVLKEDNVKFPTITNLAIVND